MILVVYCIVSSVTSPTRCRLHVDNLYIVELDLTSSLTGIVRCALMVLAVADYLSKYPFEESVL